MIYDFSFNANNLKLRYTTLKSKIYEKGHCANYLITFLGKNQESKQVNSSRQGRICSIMLESLPRYLWDKNPASHFIISPTISLFKFPLPFSHFSLTFHNRNIFAASSYIDQIITPIAHLFHVWTEKLMSTIFSKAFHKYLWLNKFSFPFHSQNIYGITNWASHFINSPQYLYLNSLFLPFSHFLLIFHNINIFAASSYIDQIITSIAHLFHVWTEKVMSTIFSKASPKYLWHNKFSFPFHYFPHNISIWIPFSSIFTFFVNFPQ